MSNISAFSYFGGSGDYENVKSQLKHRDDFSLFKSKELRILRRKFSLLKRLINNFK